MMHTPMSPTRATTTWLHAALASGTAVFLAGADGRTIALEPYTSNANALVIEVPSDGDWSRARSLPMPADALVRYTDTHGMAYHPIHPTLPLVSDHCVGYAAPSEITLDDGMLRIHPIADAHPEVSRIVHIETGYDSVLARRRADQLRRAVRPAPAFLDPHLTADERRLRNDPASRNQPTQIAVRTADGNISVIAANTLTKGYASLMVSDIARSERTGRIATRVDVLAASIGRTNQLFLEHDDGSITTVGVVTEVSRGSLGTGPLLAEALDRLDRIVRHERPVSGRAPEWPRTF